MCTGFVDDIMDGIIRHSAIKNDSSPISSDDLSFQFSLKDVAKWITSESQEECDNGWKNNQKIDRPPHRQA